MLETSLPLILLLSSFLIGSIPFGLVISKLKGIDIRKTGSGNTGATNVSRALGKKIGLLTLILDALKGAVGVFLPNLLELINITSADLTNNPKAASSLACFLGLFAILGHCFSPFLKFKGGKGVATSLGVFLSLAPIQTLFCIGVFAITFYLTRYVSLSSILAAISMPVSIWAINKLGTGFLEATSTSAGSHKALLMAAFITAIIIVARHKANIQRLLNGSESKFGR